LQARQEEIQRNQRRRQVICLLPALDVLAGLDALTVRGLLCRSIASPLLSTRQC